MIYFRFLNLMGDCGIFCVVDIPYENDGKINFPRKITKTRTKMLIFTKTMAGEEYPPFNSLNLKSERLAALQDGKAS